VLDATDIVRLVGEHVTLRPKGREYVGLCPFHDDHRPSMYVVPSKGIYHCFSCGAGGDAFGFVMNYHKMSFREALEYLAERAGVVLTARRAGAGAPADGGEAGEPALSRRAILAANQAAWAFFRVVLNHAEHGRAAREMIERRGLSREMVTLFGLGAAPEKWDGLAATIAAKGMDAAPFAAAGLLKRREGTGGAGGAAGYYDAFRHRLVFPIQDQIGRVVGFGGRRLSDEKRSDGSEEAKYLNSAESAAFDKGSTLYGLHQAAPALRSTRTAVVVEGYLDAIACHQAGIGNAVATLGTALTAGSARVLRRQCERAVLVFDGDEAGRRAARRAIEVFFAEPIDVRIARLDGVTDAKDPDELLRRPGGRALFERALAQAADPLAVMLEQVRGELEGRGVSGQARVAEEFLDRLADLGLGRVEPLRKQIIVRRLSEMTRVDADTLFSALGSRAGRAGAAAGAGTEPARAPRRLTLGERLLGCVMCDPRLAYTLGEGEEALIVDDLGADPPVRRVAEAALGLARAGDEPSLAAVLGVLEDAAEQSAATAIVSEVDRLAERAVDRVRSLWTEWMAEARRARAEREAGVGPGEKADEPGSGAEPWEGALDRLARLRTLAATVGKDRRTIPSGR
jgi:DNA primase